MRRKQRIPALFALTIAGLVSATAARAAETLVLPGLTAVVVDEATGLPARQVEVELLAQTGKSKDFRPLAEATTAADGSVRLDPQSVADLKIVRVSFTWADPGTAPRNIVYQAKIKKGGKTAGGKLAQFDKSKARYVIEGKYAGDCANLFDVRNQGSGLQLTFRKPETYLACKEPKFKFSNLAEIGGRAINKGLNFFSKNDDVRLGQNFFNELGNSPDNPILDDRFVGDYVQGLIDRIGKASDTPDMKFTVRVIDADVLNAFALPGGYVFVYRGLIDAAETESELVGVLAHEVAHVTSRHGTEGMTSAIAKIVGAMIAGELVASQMKGSNEAVKGLVKDLILTGTEFWIIGGTRKREAEADHLGAQYAWKAGYDPRGLASFFEKMSQARGYKQTRLEQFFSDHPNDDARIRDVGQKVDYFLPPRSDLVVSSEQFKAVKARLGGMQPPRASGAIAANALFSSFKAANEKLILNELRAYLDTTGSDAKEAPATEEEEEESDSSEDDEE